MSNSYPRDAWRIAGVSLVALLLLIFALYQQTIIYLTGLWYQLEAGEYGHGYLVLAISAYLIFYNRRKLAVLTPCPEFRATLAILSASVFWMVATLVDIEVLQTVGLLLLILSIVWALLGARITLILLFPLLYIGFAIPVWFPLSPLLQELTADIVFWIIRIIEVPALRIENTIVLPAGKLSVAEACSGLRYFLAALTLGALYGYLNYASFSARLIVVLVSAVAAVLANILRVFIVVYLGYATDMQHPLVSDHLNLGWYLFGGLVVILLVIDTQLKKKYLRSSNGEGGETVLQAPCDRDKKRFMMTILASFLFVSTGPLMAAWLSHQQRPASYPVQIKPSSDSGEWSVMEGYKDDWQPLYSGAMTHKIAFQNKNNRKVLLFVGLYPVQEQGKELINDLNRISDNKVWRLGYQRAKLRTLEDRQVLEQLLEKKDGSKRLVWYWYRVAGQVSVNKYHAKALQVLGMLNNQRLASVVAVATELDGNPEYSRIILAQFTEDMGLSIVRAIDGER